MVFLTCSWKFLISNKLEQLELNWKKLLGFRNMQEKLEKVISPQEVKKQMENLKTNNKKTPKKVLVPNTGTWFLLYTSMNIVHS